MLTEICAEINNYFSNEKNRIIGDFAIVDGNIVPPINIKNGQYYRIVGSTFNDGVYEFGGAEDALWDEPKFHGAIWLMDVPRDVIQLAEEIKEWKNNYCKVDSPNMSPYSSESFGGYSYSKARGYASSGGGMLTSWENIFASRLKPYRRISAI